MLKKCLGLFLLIVFLLPSFVLADTLTISEEENGEYHEINVKIENTYLKYINQYKGDLNNNGKIDLSDIIMLLKKYLGIEESMYEELRVIDMDSDNKVGLGDVIALLKVYLMGEELQLVKDNYLLNYDFSYIKNNNNGDMISNKEELINYFYYIINSGMTIASGRCTEEYTDCISDLKAIVYDSNFLSSVNDFVHPFNKLLSILFRYSIYQNTFTINITHEYSDEEIKEIEDYVEGKLAILVTNDMSDREKIKAVLNTAFL